MVSSKIAAIKDFIYKGRKGSDIIWFAKMENKIIYPPTFTRIAELFIIALSKNGRKFVSVFWTIETVLWNVLFLIKVEEVKWNNKLKDVSVLANIKNEYEISFNLDISNNINVRKDESITMP